MHRPICLGPPLRASLRPSISRASRIGARSAPVDMESIKRFLEEDLTHLFDDQGIDRRAYADEVRQASVRPIYPMI